MKYLRLVAIQLRISVASAMAYRANFIIEGVMAALWLALTLLPLIVLYGVRSDVNGWDMPSALVVMAYFTGLRAALVERVDDQQQRAEQVERLPRLVA